MSIPAKKVFITTKKQVTLFELLNSNPKTKEKAQTIIESGGVWHNKKRIIDLNHKIPAKDTVITYISSRQGDSYTLNKSAIVFECNDFIIINKPAAISTTAERSNIFFNLRYGVEKYLNREIENKKKWYQPQPLSRLDFYVSGLVLFSKNKDAERILFRLTKERKIKKAYHAQIPSAPNNPNCLRIKDFINDKGPVKICS